MEEIKEFNFLYFMKSEYKIKNIFSQKKEN